MKSTIFLAFAATSVGATNVVGEYGDGNWQNDDEYATVVGGDMNTASGKYSTIGGGYMNYAKGSYSTISGGQSNTVLSNYGSILGGYANRVQGRFGTVVGGSKNTAAGRHSVAMGFSAVASAEHSMTACFTGGPCVNDVANSIAFFAENMYINDINLNDVLGSRRLLGVEDSLDTLDKASDALAKYTAEYDELIADVDAMMAKQDALFSAVANKLA